MPQGLLSSKHKCLLLGCFFFCFCEHFLRYFMFSPRKQSLQPKGSASRKRDHCFWSSAFTWGKKKKVRPWWWLVTTLQSANPNTNHKMRGIVEVFLPLWVSPHSFWGFCSPWISLYNFIYCDPDVCVKEELNWLSCLPDELRRRQVQGLWKWGPCRFSGVLCLNICFVLLKIFIWQLALNSQYGMSCTECPLALSAGPSAWGPSWLRS